MFCVVVWLCCVLLCLCVVALCVGSVCVGVCVVVVFWYDCSACLMCVFGV